MFGAPRSSSTRLRGRDVVLVLALAGLHVLATWGDAALYLADYGAWLHAVERFVAGETPYVDYYWMYPPLSLWLLGTVGTILEPSLFVLRCSMSAVFIGILLFYARYVAFVVPDSLRFATIALGVVFATGYAAIGSASLPMGMYTPAAPFGVLFLLAAVVGAILVLRGEAPGAEVLLGAAAGLCILTKHDVWPPALYLVAVVVIWNARAGRPESTVRVLAAGALVLAAGVLVAGLSIGWSFLPRTVWTPGVGDLLGGRLQFSWERFTVQAAVTAALTAGVAGVAYLGNRERRGLATVALGAGVVAIAAVGIYVAASYASASSVIGAPEDTLRTEAQAAVLSAGTEPLHMVKRAVRLFRDRAFRHALPTILPVLLLGLVLFRRGPMPDERRRLLLFLLGLAVAARLRRGFEHVEWFHLLLEWPIYVVFLSEYLRLRPGSRSLNVVLAGSLIFGAVSYWWLGAGWGTRRGAVASVSVESVRGTFRTNEAGAEWLRWLRRALDREDPDGDLPLLVFGQTGGLAYWTGRRNPTPWMFGSVLGFWEAERVLEPLLPPGRELFFLDVSLYDDLRRPQQGLHLGQWDLPLEPSRFAVDRRLMAPFVRDCTRVDSLGNAEDPFMTLYQCPGS